ncbi:hypothetical protein AM587_10005243 [Phytophthora nicotianae]|uniref:SAM domain-containing protein n=1 Tax=Phytophthora nicotianae TaxID=4792 RepID=A0A0W8D205_PHYNI|nr:hypothetical protein AM587_10005243 [Phytophthora nicotianae]
MNQRAAHYTAAAVRGKPAALESSEEDPTDPHAYRKGSPVKARSPSDNALLGTDDDRIDPGEDEGDDLVDDLDQTAAYAAFLQEQAEMRARFTFKDETRKTLGDKFIAALRRKRRMLGRNENLRFRELYKPPEPIAVLLVLVVSAAVTLITKYSYSPLHVAVHFEHEAIIKLLLSASPAAKVNAVDSQGNRKIVKLLLDDVNIQLLKSKSGTTPVELAEELEFSDMRAALVDHATRAAGRTQLSSWLASIGLVEYAQSFFDEGFDDAHFLLATGGLDDKTLDTMHIQKAGHRAKLQKLYQLKEFLHVESEAESSEESNSSGDSDEEESDSDGSGSDNESS